MRILTTFILTVIFLQQCCSQTADTIRIYDYLKLGDTWKLKIKNNKTFTLYTSSLFTKEDITSTGTCKIADTTIQFLCDISKLKNKYLVKERLRQFSNIPFILCGDTFPKQNNFFVPRNINYEPEDSTIIPKGICARYYRGDGLSSNIIELKQDGTYVFSDNDCIAHFKEEGTWALNNEIISFTPKEEKWSMLEWVTKDRKLYLTESYLVGKKVAKKVTQTKKTIVTETFFFLSKEPIYLND
ncbi:MAG TPA: hypothetical protein VIJ92_14545 [Ginsengibacter sp.]